MKQHYKILLIGILAVALLDTIGSIASRQLDFNYSLLSPVSFLIYGTTAFIATRRKDLKTGVFFAAILGLFDSTIGWKLSMLLDANTGGFAIEVTTGLWIMTAVLVIGFSALVGLLGGALAGIVKKKETNVKDRM